jgi:hypothetical protein
MVASYRTLDTRLNKVTAAVNNKVAELSSEFEDKMADISEHYDKIGELTNPTVITCQTSVTAAAVMYGRTGLIFQLFLAIPRKNLIVLPISP